MSFDFEVQHTVRVGNRTYLQEWIEGAIRMRDAWELAEQEAGKMSGFCRQYEGTNHLRYVEAALKKVNP
jgi:hypothetical protein